MDAGGEGRARHGPYRIEGVEATQGRGLHEEVARRRGLGGPGQDGKPGGVGRELAEKMVSRPASDEMDALHRFGLDLPDLLEDLAVGEGQAFQDGPGQGAGAIVAKYGENKVLLRGDATCPR